jgi:hypothetical protein
MDGRARKEHGRSHIVNRRRRFLALAAALIAVVLATVYGRARAQVVAPSPQDLRFQAVLNEPIATPDRRSVVAGTSALVVRDRVTGRCYIAVTIGDSMGLSPAACEE